MLYAYIFIWFALRRKTGGAFYRGCSNKAFKVTLIEEGFYNKGKLSRLLLDIFESLEVTFNGANDY